MGSFLSCLLVQDFYPIAQIAPSSGVFSQFGTASLSQILGGLLAYGCYHMPSFRWQGLFVIFGGLTIIHGICSKRYILAR